MSKKLVFGLFISWFFVLMYKYPIWENLAFYIEDYARDYGKEIYDISHFCAVFLFPFLLSITYMYYLLKYQKKYFTVVKWILIALIAVAIFFAFHGLLWVFSGLADYLPNLGGFFVYLIYAETYFSVSLLLLFIALFFFAFGKKDIPKECNL